MKFESVKNMAAADQTTKNTTKTKNAEYPREMDVARPLGLDRGIQQETEVVEHLNGRASAKALMSLETFVSTLLRAKMKALAR